MDGTSEGIFKGKGESRHYLANGGVLGGIYEIFPEASMEKFSEIPKVLKQYINLLKKRISRAIPGGVSGRNCAEVYGEKLEEIYPNSYNSINKIFGDFLETSLQKSLEESKPQLHINNSL